jgi:ATP-dependent DNA helicase RecQ
LIDLLLGETNERMSRFGHDRLPTFGVGADLDRRTWQSVFRQLVAGGFLEVDLDGHGGMRLGGDAHQVLRGQRTVELRHDPAPQRAPRRAKGAAPSVLEGDADRGLFEALRAKRRELAKAHGLAPFLEFPDRTLIELAATQPPDSASLDTIHGIGQAKRERWGDDFLGVIRAFLSVSPNSG